MNTMRLCKECSAPLPPDGPEGLCPRCLMKSGLGTEAGTQVDDRAASAEAPAGEDISKHFPQLEILGIIGRGGMGIVYKARQKQLDRTVALKILPPEISDDPTFAERFGREARALAKLNHPNIVSIYDSGQTGGLYYFLMEFVDGTNLRQALQAGQISPREALAIVPVICDALQYAHDLGIVHRDIKPENVLLDKKGRVKIADFGLAKLVQPDAADASLTMAGSTMGTPKYMAPEQMDKPEGVDHRADIYSLGVIFYEMLTGELPVGRFALPSQKVHVDVRLDEVVLRTLEQKPERRYQQASQVKSEVETIAGYFDRLPPEVRRAIGFEYRSQASIFGWPLLHIAYGLDPSTGQNRVAKGVFAFGTTALGLFAFGGRAAGFFAFGGITLGIISMGGLGFGVFSLSGLSFGLILAYGGFCVAPLAIGGMAIGYYAMGGMAMGIHPNDGEGWRLLGGMRGYRLLTTGWVIMFLICMLLSVGGRIVGRMLARQQKG